MCDGRHALRWELLSLALVVGLLVIVCRQASAEIAGEEEEVYQYALLTTFSIRPECCAMCLSWSAFRFPCRAVVEHFLR